ncbi:hypothetical protein GKZ68_05170 [Hymenobacter sp. BRD128]|uniref:hypothetical protein n=1 Tax=Hymenobacter sp. BRD128 TaxID=2675878 RepID=UPI001567C093|nr:hypothetical protein [Hymenobacter sp. BRD128]QKG56083.1 hypothetical protein GKZ68_05170 [Hymenobacter sp. BRD128]
MVAARAVAAAGTYPASFGFQRRNLVQALSKCGVAVGLTPACLCRLFYRSYALLAVTDYDAAYLYIFQKSSTWQISLGDIYKLAAARGCWQLHYLDEQQQRRKLQLVPLGTGWFWPNDNSRIQGFIDAVRQHNPNLDVRRGWPR